MKLKPLTLLLIAIAFVFGVAVYLAETRNRNRSAEPETSEIFAFEEDQVQTLTVTTDAATLSFEKAADGEWQMLEPERVPADEASVVFLLNLLATGTSDRTLTVPRTDAKQFGVDDPLARVQVELNNDETHTLVLGDYDFNQSFIYAQPDPPPVAEVIEPEPEADPEADEVQVLLVSPSFEDAVTRPVDEWKQQVDGAPAQSADPASDPALEQNVEQPPESAPDPLPAEAN